MCIVSPRLASTYTQCPPRIVRGEAAVLLLREQRCNKAVVKADGVYSARAGAERLLAVYL